MGLTDTVAGVHGYRYSLTIVDHYSRYVKFFPLKTKNTTHIIDKLKQYVADYGAPGGIVLDNGGEFTSREFRRYCEVHHITLYYVTPYHPLGNSITERMHRTLKSILWPDLLQSCQVIMNRAVHGSTGHQPFFAFFTRHPPRMVGAPLPSVDGSEDELQTAKALIVETQQRMTRKYRAVANRKRKEQRVEVGTLVWVRKETPLPGRCKKLNARWDGVYRVLEVVMDGSVYVVNIFTGRRVQHAAEQAKPYLGEEEWLMDPLEESMEPDSELEPVPPRTRKPPRRLIEEC